MRALSLSVRCDVQDGSPSLSIRRTFAATFSLPKKVAKPQSSPKLYQNPMALAEELQRRIDSGTAANRAELTRQLGVSRAHVTQVLRMLHLASQVREALLVLGDPMLNRIKGAHSLRSLAMFPVEEKATRIEELVASRPQRD